MRTVLCSFILLSCSTQAATDHPAQVAGIYEGTLAVKNADGRKMMLNLKQDGSCEFRDGEKSTPGHWSATGQQLQVEREGPGRPMVWKIGKNTLVLRDANKTDYGKKGLTLRRPR